MLSFLFFILTVGIGFFGIIQTIDFCGYLHKYQRREYDMLTFERPFGISREDFLIYPIKPHKFIPYLFSDSEEEHPYTKAYKMRLKLIWGLFLLFGVALNFIP
jgi:hypothetical protein